MLTLYQHYYIIRRIYVFSVIPAKLKHISLKNYEKYPLKIKAYNPQNLRTIVLKYI